MKRQLRAPRSTAAQPRERRSRSASDRAIIVAAEPFGCGFDVRVDPPMPDGRDYGRELPTIRTAREYARELREQTRLPIFDRGDS